MKKSVIVVAVSTVVALAATGLLVTTVPGLAAASGPDAEPSAVPVVTPATPTATPDGDPTPAPTPTRTPRRATPAPEESASPTPTEPEPTVTPTRQPTSKPPKLVVPAPDRDDYPAGPSQAPACHGVVVEPGDDAAEVVDREPAGSTICFAAGLHRITRVLEPKADQVLGSDEEAVLTGSVRLTTWVASGNDWVIKGVLPPAYEKTGQCEDNVANICHLREQLFRDGDHLKRVASRDAVVPGTFYGDYAADAVYVGDNPAGHALEMSRTPTAIASRADGVEVRGLTVEHFASAPQDGAVVLGPNWKVVANEIRWNHAVGAMLRHADGAELEQNVIRSNGQLGVGQYSSTDGRIAGNQIRDNNTDGFWIADWESGGVKTTWSARGSVTDNLIESNRGVGLWSDAYDDGRTLARNRISDNAADGIRFEISRRGVIADNVVTGNGFGTGRGSGTSLWDGGGINVNTSATVQVRDNTVAGNVNGVAIQSRTRGDGPWGRNVLRDVVVSGNRVTMKGGTTASGMVQNAGSPVPAGEVVLTGNDYYLDSLRAERFQKFGRWFTATQWRDSGQESDSRFTLGRIAVEPR